MRHATARANTYALAAALALAPITINTPPAATHLLAHNHQQLQRTALTPAAALAVGAADMKIDLKINGYEETTCPDTLKQGRAGGSLGGGASVGIAQKCVKVTARAVNNQKTTVEDASVFGFVINGKDGSSVVANNPDMRTDAGQFAMIDKVPPGETDVEFLFVAQQNTDCRPTRKTKTSEATTCPIEGTEPLVPLKFQGIKAISYPGGDRYKTYDECEQNEFAEGCY